jgi:uncharacterized protein
MEETMKPLKICACLLVVSCFALAEDRPQLKAVRVTGTAEVKVVPDRAVIGIGVEKESPSASQAKAAESAASRKILAALRAGGVDEKDIQTTYLALRPSVRYEKKVRIPFFVAEQTLAITVRDLSKLDLLLQSLVRAGGNRIDFIHYETSDLRKYRDQARDLAVKAAREKAQALAAALGQEIGKAQYIEEVPADQYSNTIQNSVSDYDRGREYVASTAAGRSSISASVTVAFDLN